MKILIVTTFYPPEDSIACQRPYSWYKYLISLGHDVHVLTVESYLKNSVVEDKNIIRIQRPFYKFLRGNFSVAKGNGKGKINFLKYLKIYLKKKGVSVGSRAPDIHDLWAIKAWWHIRNSTWDVVVTTSGPYSVSFIGFLLKKFGRTKIWVSDYRDLWVDNHIFKGLPLISKLEAAWEKIFIKNSNIITTVSEPLALALGGKYDRNVSVIYNGYDPDDYEDNLNFLDDKDKTFKIIYTGTIIPGYRDPSVLFQAIKELLAEGLISTHDISIEFYGKNSDVLDLAILYDIQACYKFGGNVSRSVSLNKQQNADLLLLLEYEDEKTKGILTGKMFEYIRSGTFVLAVGVDNTSEIGKILSSTATGIGSGKNVALIKSIILEFINLKKNGALIKVKGVNIDKYNRYNQSKALFDLVDQCLLNSGRLVS